MPVWSWFFIAAGVLIASTVVIAVAMSVTGRGKARRKQKDVAAEPEMTSPPEKFSATVKVPESPPSDDELIAPADDSELQSRWNDIEAAFVDDPAGSVQKADGLVEEAVKQVMSRIDDARSRLEAQWARDDVSTEDLRLTLTRYRELFQRLLSV